MRELAAIIVLSRVKQARPLRERIDIWRGAIHRLSENLEGQRFELLDDGTLIPWEEGRQNSWVAKGPRR